MEFGTSNKTKYQYLVNFPFKDLHTMCPRRSCPFYIVTYYIKWITYALM